MTEDPQTVGESRDGTGAGDHDTLHTWGNWRASLTTMQQARLVLLRGQLRDMSHAPASIRSSLRFSGDSNWDWVVPTGTGLFVPDPRWSEDA